MGSWQAPGQLWVLGDCLLHSPGRQGPGRVGGGGGVGIIRLHAQGTLLLLAEPKIEFEMSNPEPSCLHCERQGLAGSFLHAKPSGQEEGAGETAPNQLQG